MGDQSNRIASEGLSGGVRSRSSLGIHLLAGLPTDAVRRGIERVGDSMQVVPLDALDGVAAGASTRAGVELPPFVEPSSVVDSWEDCDFLTYRFGRPAHIAGVVTFLDVEAIENHLTSIDPISSRGWGRSDRDPRAVADIAVEQIEAATHLVLVGATPAPSTLARSLQLLNPRAQRLACWHGSGFDWSHPASLRCDASARSVRITPPWLEALRGEVDPAPGCGLFVYRRTRPFVLDRLRKWLQNPPQALLRGKGHVWLAGESERSFGYSCAGSAHRLFAAGRWWASYSEGDWPSCRTQRRRLLERWHPRFGDRRQELVFAGIDLDGPRLAAGLDGCLVPEDSIDAGSHSTPVEHGAPPSRPSASFH